MSEKPEVTFIMMIADDNPDRFLLMRQVGDYGTHYLGPDGGWVAWPEDDSDLAQMFENLADPNNLPKFDLQGAADINADLNGTEAGDE